MHHTYLFLEDMWTFKGTYLNEEEQEIFLNGKVIILHKKDRWLKCVTVKMSSEQPFDFHMNYSIIPTSKNTMNWTCVNTLMGNFHGKYVIREDSILLIYEPNNRGYYGFECFQKLDDITYEVDGMFLKDDRTISSWKVTLKSSSTEQDATNTTTKYLIK